MSVVVTLPAPAGVTGLGARVELPVTREVVSAWNAATLADGVWTATLTDSPYSGDLIVAWRAPADGSAYDALVPLHYVGAVPAPQPDPAQSPTVTLLPAGEYLSPQLPSTDLLPGDGTLPGAHATSDPGLPPWAPEPDDIAALCGAYTREQQGGGYASLEPQNGRERGVFSERTTPTISQVYGYIAGACGEVQGRVGRDIPASCWPLAETCASWHAAASVEAKRKPAGTDDADGLYRAFIANYRASLDELVEQARRGPTRLY